MVILSIVLWCSLLLGQLGGIPLGDGVILYVQDIVLSAIILVAVLRHGLIRKLRTFRLFLPIALFTLAGVLSFTVNLSSGSLYLVRWVVYALFYAAVLVSPLSARFWLWWLASMGVAFSAIGLVQFVWYPDLRNLWYLGWDPHYYRVFATLLDPNYVGILLVLTLFLLLYLFRRFTWLVGMVGVALLLTYSRSSYLALLGGVGMTVAIHKRWKEGLFLVLLVLLAVVYVPKPGGDTLSLDRYDSTAARIQNWGQAIARMGERPVFGHGFTVVPAGRRGAGIDSSILFVGVTTGIAGLISYLWLIVEQVTMALRLQRKTFRLLFLASLAATLVHSLFVNSLFYPWVMVWMWTLSAVVEKDYRW